MADPMSDFATVGDYRASGRTNLGLALSLLFFGLAAGAVAALLTAPKTGKQMRRTLRRKYQDALEAFDDWGDQAEDWTERGSDWAEQAKSRGSDWADQAKSRGADWSEKVRSKVKPLKKAWNG